MSATPLRMVVAFIGTVLLSCVVGIILLAARHDPIPDVLQNVAIGSLTGLVGVLVPTRSVDPGARVPLQESSSSPAAAARRRGRPAEGA